MRRGYFVVGIIFLLLVQIVSNAQIELTDVKVSNSIHEDSLFNQTGFNEDGVYTDSTGEVRVYKPVFLGYSITMADFERTGACSVSIEFWMRFG